MLHHLVLKIFEELDRADSNGSRIKKLFSNYGFYNTKVKTVRTDKGTTDFIKITIPGLDGKENGGHAPTLGIIGQLGGIGARPEQVGLVSDGDGAIAALASALKIVDMKLKGDNLLGDVIITTHIDPNAPTVPHEPVPFMGSSVEIKKVNEEVLDEDMDAIISIDTTKGNRILNENGISITPTVKSGYILRVNEYLLEILQNVTGKRATVLPLSIQDITPYGNGIYHLNSILQPSTHTDKPVIGLAVTTESTVPGSSTGASQLHDIEQAARFSVEVAKYFGKKSIHFYDEDEYSRLIELYGSMSHLQTLGN